MKYFFFVLLLANVLLLLWEINTGALHHQELNAVPPVQEVDGVEQIRLLSEITRDMPPKESIPIMDKTALQQHTPFAVEKDSWDEHSMEQPGAMAQQEVNSADSAIADLPRKTDAVVPRSGPVLTAGSQPSTGLSEKIAPLVKLTDSLDRPVQVSDDAQAVASGSASVGNELSSAPAGMGHVPEEFPEQAVSSPVQTGGTAVLDEGPVEENDGAGEKPLDGGGVQEQVGASGNAVTDSELAADQEKSSPGPAAMQHSDKPEKIQILPVLSASSSRHDAVNAKDNSPVVLSCYEIGPFPDAERLQADTTAIAREVGRVENFSVKETILRGYVVLYPAAETFEKSRDNYYRLKKQGYSDLWLFRKTAWRGAVSMGIYSNENRARRIARRLLDKGMNVQVKPVHKSVSQHFLRVTSEKSGLQALQKAVADLKKQVPDLQLKETAIASCNNNR